MSPETILQDVLATTPVEYLSQIEDAYTIGIEDAFIAIGRANLLRPSHIKHANMLMEICIEQAKLQTEASRNRVPREGLDL